MAHLQIKNLTFSYPGAAAPTLKQISLDIHQGEYVALCGRSGSGKTTLLRHLKSVLTPHGTCSGGVFLDRTPLSDIPLGEQAGTIGFVMQSPEDQIVTDKVWHELAFGLESLGTDPALMGLRVAEMSSYFGIAHWLDREVAQLSGGQKQLLNLAAIMAMHPQILILDEPTSQLDPIAASDFLNTVKKINLELGTTVIITEHRLEDIFHAADRCIVMEQGEILACGAPRTVGKQLWRQESPMFAALPTPTRVFYRAGGAGDCPLTVREGRRWLTESFQGKALICTEPADTQVLPSSPKPALRIRSAWFRYEKDAPDVLKGVSLEVAPGTVHAIMGGNGTGKSTLLKAAGGICKLYRGSIQVFGKELKAYRGGQLYQGCLAMMPQEPKALFVRQTVGEDLAEMTGNREEIARVARLCAIDHLLQAHPGDLSGGEIQRSALAKVLLTKPRLLLLDEPTKGMDSFFKLAFAGILQELKSQGVTTVIVSHDVEFCADHADAVSMFFDGSIITTDTPRRFFGQNSFYTTAANRMSRCLFHGAVTAEDVARLYRANMEGQA